MLLEAEWDRACHEVWVSVVPPKEVSAAVKRVLEDASLGPVVAVYCGRIETHFTHSIGIKENC